MAAKMLFPRLLRQPRGLLRMPHNPFQRILRGHLPQLFVRHGRFFLSVLFRGSLRGRQPYRNRKGAP